MHHALVLLPNCGQAHMLNHCHDSSNTGLDFAGTWGLIYPLYYVLVRSNYLLGWGFMIPKARCYWIGINSRYLINAMLL